MVNIWAENEYEGEDFESIISFDYEKLAAEVADEVLKETGCPFPAEVNLTLLDDESMHRINLENRGIDRTTDVLSFPVFAYSVPAAFDEVAEDKAGSFDPDSGNLMLGDILISVKKVAAQAEEYGHSTKREFAFLVAHSTLHLIGYDHMEEDEEKIMFAKQEEVLAHLGLTRDIK